MLMGFGRIGLSRERVAARWVRLKPGTGRSIVLLREGRAEVFAMIGVVEFEDDEHEEDWAASAIVCAAESRRIKGV
jgi:hypothetical protein